jgi:hypothetical protein
VTDKYTEMETDSWTTTEFAQRLFSEADLDLKKETINAIKIVLRAIESRVSNMRTEMYLAKKN